MSNLQDRVKAIQEAAKAINSSSFVTLSLWTHGWRAQVHYVAEDSPWFVTPEAALEYAETRLAMKASEQNNLAKTLGIEVAA